MTRDELIELGVKIVACEGTKAKIDAMNELFSSIVPHPNGANLFYHPETYD
jgi:hypothetical protein